VSAITTSPDPGPASPLPVARAQQWALIAGAVGLLGWAACALLLPPRDLFFRAYLWAFMLALGVTLGSLVVVLIQHLTGGNWGWVLRHTLEAGTRTLYFIVPVLFLPLLLGLHDLYVWTRPEVVAHNERLQHKAPYLSLDVLNVQTGVPIPGWVPRAVIYFLVWGGLAYALNRWSRRVDEGPVDDPTGHRLRRFSAVGIVLYGLSVTFAAVDWMMSLEPDWFSTMYGPLIAVGQILGGFAFAVAVTLLLGDREPLAGALGRLTLRDLGSLMLAFVMVWAYLAFSQFLIIWSGNLPEEITWYLYRSRGGWQWVAGALALFQFALPFLLLLSRDIKRDRRALAGVALFVLAMRALDLFWLIEPAGGQGLSPYHLLYPLPLLGVGGVWLFLFLRELQRRPLLGPPEIQLSEAASHG
jgi:hypothetical protein